VVEGANDQMNPYQAPISRLNVSNTVKLKAQRPVCIPKIFIQKKNSLHPKFKFVLEM
jgi:hypothetical protein